LFVFRLVSSANREAFAMNKRDITALAVPLRLRIAALTFVASLCAAAPLALGETLDEALAKAYADNPTLLAARAQLRQVDEQVPQALAGWRPQADISGGGGYVNSTNSNNNNTQSNLSQSSGPAVAFELGIKQPIYNFITPATVHQAKNAVRAQRARLDAVEQQTLLLAATAYLDVLKNQAVVNLTTEQQQQLQRDLDTARRKYAIGELKTSDVAQSEASVARAKALRSQAEAALASARATYRAVTGESPGALELPAMPPGLPETADAAVKASPDNPNVIAADFAERAAEDGVDVSFGQELPQFFLQANVGPTQQTILGLVSFPLYHGGSMDSQVRAAKQLVAERRQEADAQRRQAEQTALSSFETLRSGQDTVASYEAQVKAAELAAAGIRRQGELGLRTVTDVLLAQQQVLEAHANLIGAQRDSLVNAYQLLAAVGKLSARDLALKVPYYDPLAHYEDVHNKWLGRDIGKDR
jgi:outer membrane protein